MTAPSPVTAPPPVWFIAAALVQRVIAGKRTPTKGSTVLAGVVAAASGALAVRSVLTLRAAGAEVSPMHLDRNRTLVTTGPFACTRNPIYLAGTGLLIAHALRHRSVPAIAPAIGFAVALDRTQVPAEERALRARHGKAYDRYRRRTPRWIGLPGR